MRIGIIFGTDWSKGIPIGGTSRVILSLLEYLPGEVYLLGTNIRKSSNSQGMSFRHNHFNMPLFDVSHPSIVPLRLKAMIGYFA